MSDPTITKEEREAISTRRRAAAAMISALCKPTYDPDHRDWMMSIPARPDHDPDLVIGAALRDNRTLLAALETAEVQIAEQSARIAELERENEKLCEWLRIYTIAASRRYGGSGTEG